MFPPPPSSEFLYNLPKPQSDDDHEREEDEVYNTKATKEDTQELNCEWDTVKNEDETQEFKDLYHK